MFYIRFDESLYCAAVLSGHERLGTAKSFVYAEAVFLVVAAWRGKRLSAFKKSLVFSNLKKLWH